MSATTTGVCAGCGAPLPPSRNPGNPRKWCSERCRKNSYGDPCIDCGAQTRYGAERTRVPDPRCSTCAAAQRSARKREAIVEAIQRWARIYGEPPCQTDWNPYHAREVLHDQARAERFYDDHWPCFTSVFDWFGSWNEAIIAAGFTPRPRHGGGGNELRRRSAVL